MNEYEGSVHQVPISSALLLALEPTYGIISYLISFTQMVARRLRSFGSWFHPFLFVMVMGTGISADLLFEFPYEARWLKICSYPMFATAVLLFLYLQLMGIVHFIFYVTDKSFEEYVGQFIRNVTISTGWGTYPMGLSTIINYLYLLAEHRIESKIKAKRVMRLVYVLWWYDLALALLCAWGISFLVWQRHFMGPLGKHRSHQEKVMSEHLNSTLLLIIIPLVVNSSSSGLFTMTDLFSETFNRNIQLLTLVITVLVWLQAQGFVAILFVINFWNFYVNKLPAMMQAFTTFLFLGPMGQGAYGINLLIEDIRLYVEKYYNGNNGNVNNNNSDLQRQILLLAVPWSFKIIALMLAFLLLSFGYFFTVIGFTSLSSHWKSAVEINVGSGIKRRRIWHFHRGWFAMTFPMGSMSLGTYRIWVLYNDYVPMKTFRVLGTIYASICIIWTLVCLSGTFYHSVIPRLKKIRIRRDHRSSTLTEDQLQEESKFDTTNSNFHEDNSSRLV